MTDRTNVITVTQPNLEWINANVPGSSKQKRLETLLAFYKERHDNPVVAMTREDFATVKAWAEKEGCSANTIIERMVRARKELSS